MSRQPFEKFINPKNNAAIKEKHRQEKKIAKKQKAAAIENRFEEKRAMRYRGFAANNSPATEPPGKPGRKQKYPQSKQTPQVLSATIKNTVVSQMPLNKFLAHCGVTSRRDAVTLIVQGKVSVNKTVITQPAFKVNEKDDVVFNGKLL